VTLEERVLSLGWVAEWFRDQEARNAAAADLAALAQWPRYGQYAGPNLSSAHTGRILWTALTRWRWVGDDLRTKLREACRRHVDESLPASDKTLSMALTKEDILREKAPYGRLHNIGLIGTVGTALTAVAARHPAAGPLNARLEALFGAVLELRSKGFSEGVAYDGYVLDFIADWLGTLPQKDRSPILDHPSLDHYLDQSYMLAAPGAAEQVAEIGDVEPREMPFHLSAQAKLLGLRRNAVRDWYLARCPVDPDRRTGCAPGGEDRLAREDAAWRRARRPLCGRAPHRLGNGRRGRGRVVHQLAHGPHPVRQRHAGPGHAREVAYRRPGLPAVRERR
jgi:hypothetical protein